MMLRLARLNFSFCWILLFALILSIPGTANVFADDQLPSGRAKLPDWDEAHQGFSFEDRSPAGSKMDFFIADRGEESVIHAFDAPGIMDMGSIPLGQIKSAPEVGYKNTFRPLQGHSYVLRSGGVYAKIYLREIFSANDYPSRTVTEYEFDWVIQPDGTRNFGEGGSSGSSQVGTKESLGEVLKATASESNWPGTISTMPWRDFESVFWTGVVENRSVTMGIIIHDSGKLADEDLKLFGESGYGYSPAKFKNCSAFISKTDGKANGIYWRMGEFVLYVNDPISEEQLYEVASGLYSRANSSPVISESQGVKEKDGGNEQIEDKTVEVTPAADGQVYAYSYRNWNRANRGKWDRMKAGWNPVGGESRAYLKFDVSKLPSTGQVILKLYQKKVQNDGAAPLGIYRVTSKWKEGNSTYVSGRQSPTAAPGELSWEQQPTYEEQPVIIFRAPSEGLLQIEITPLVRQWQSGVPNYGLMIRPAAYQPSRENAHIFTTKEWKEPMERPRLVGTVDEKAGIQSKSQSSSGDNDTAIGDAAVDLDGDGVDDNIDQCPNTPSGAKVDSKGCEITDKVLIERDHFQLESGRITLTHEWKEVSFAKPFNYPVIVAKPLSYNGTDPATVAIKDVTSTGFKVKIQEWTYIEGNHTEETLSYLVVERGHFTLDSGLEIEADVISTDVTGASKKTTPQGAQYVNFFSGFSTDPVVFGARSSFNGEHTVATRIDKVTRQGFNVLMQEQESNEQSHVHETINYIALSEGSTGIGEETLVVGRVKVDHKPYTTNLPSGIKVRLHVDEEQSLDEETDHGEESVGYLSFSGRPLLFIADIQTIEGSDTANLRYEAISEQDKEVHVVIIDGSVKPEIVTKYRVEVTGSIEPVDGSLQGHEVSFNPSDSISGKTATGQVDRGKDGFKVTGQITSIELNHPEATVVLVDGDKVQEADISGPSRGKSTGTVTLKHWGGEGSYEEGFDFSEGEVQRDGETGSDRTSLNPDFFYTGSWARSFPTRVAHDATNPLLRVDYGKVSLDSVTKVPPQGDPGFEEGHLKVGHVYGFYTKEGSYVLLKVQNEEEIPREDWHVGTLTFSWKLLAKKSGTSASGCQYAIGGPWTEVSGYCKGTLWDIRFEGEKVPKLSATVNCANGYRGKWEARNVKWEEKCQLDYQIVHECSVCKGLDKTRRENHRLEFLNNQSAILTLDDGTEIHLGRPK